MSVNKTPQVVTIAGSDSGGSAGAQADLKTFQARHVFGMSIFVALTAQNTLGVQESMMIPCEFVAAQFKSLAEDFNIKAVKTGMLGDNAHVKEVVKQLKEVDFGPLVVDPVMIAKGGHKLLSDDAIDTIRQELLPLAYVVTPNLPEAEVLLGHNLDTKESIIQGAKELQKYGVKHVIMKGGHGTGGKSSDFVLFEDGTGLWLTGQRIDTKATHGTGDTFSACIVAELAKGQSIQEAILTSKRFIQGAISQPIYVGHGHGPTNHWALLDDSVLVERV